jgi:hypothetical protein
MSKFGVKKAKSTPIENDLLALRKRIKRYANDIIGPNGLIRITRDAQELFLVKLRSHPSGNRYFA